MADVLAIGTYEPLVGTVFDLLGAGGTLPLELVQVEARNGKGTEGFSLFFRGPVDPVAPHCTHTLRHPALGTFELFLGPIHAPNLPGITYQAVVARLVS